MKETMHALTIHYDTEWSDKTGFVKREMPVPQLDEKARPEDADWVVLKPVYTGVCGSDRGLWFRNAWGDAMHESLEREDKATRIIGHEMFGEIVAVGSKVAKKYGYKVGQMVAAESHLTCGKCYQCQRGEKHVCTNEIIMGITIDGCFAEYIKLPAGVLWPTDTSLIRPEIACMQEPFGNGVHAATKVNLRDKTVAILGCGPIGLFTVLIARAYGAKKIIAVDPLEKNRNLAKQFGADETLTTEASKDQLYDAKLVERIKELTDGVGVDAALEMAGFHSSVNNAIHAVRRGGDVVLFGLKSGDATIAGFDRMIARGVTLHCIIGREIFKTWHATRALLEDQSNGIQDALWRYLLQEGEGTIVNFSEYDPTEFEKKMLEHPKILIRY